jgi:hypothetical protein
VTKAHKPLCCAHHRVHGPQGVARLFGIRIDKVQIILHARDRKIWGSRAFSFPFCYMQIMLLLCRNLRLVTCAGRLVALQQFVAIERRPFRVALSILEPRAWQWAKSEVLMRE